MPDPTLDTSLVQLAEVVKRLNTESELLNRQIADFEQRLVEMAPGFEVWLRPFRFRAVDSDGAVGTGSQLGFAKFREWGLWLYRGMFDRNEDEVWTPREDCTLSRLTEASREDRIVAVGHFDKLGWSAEGRR